MMADGGHSCRGCDRGESDGDLCPKAADTDELPARCVGEWSEAKLHYMRRYGEIFATGMRNKWPNRVYVDLFAGPGRSRVRPQGFFANGSPLVALSQPFTHFELCDLSPDVTTALQNRVFKVARPDQHVLVHTGDANAVATDINAKVRRLGRSTLAFAFIDPTGTQIAFDSIRRLTAGIKMDLLINFPLGMNLKRQFHYRLDDPVGESEWDAYFGTTVWRAADHDPDGLGPALLRLYKRQLRTLGYSFVGDSQTIRNTRSNAAYYVLVFASRDARGEQFWNEIVRVAPTGQRKLL